MPGSRMQPLLDGKALGRFTTLIFHKTDPSPDILLCVKHIRMSSFRVIHPSAPTFSRLTSPASRESRLEFLSH
jgi:hypothetical protein